METLGNKIMPKLCSKFYCNFCDYGTSKKSGYDNHLISSKHKKISNGNLLESAGNKNMPKLCSPSFCCETCLKYFKTRSGLWKHSKNCISEKDNKLHIEKRISGFNFPHGVDYKNNRIAITNYGDNTIRIFDVNELIPKNTNPEAIFL